MWISRPFAAAVMVSAALALGGCGRETPDSFAKFSESIAKDFVTAVESKDCAAALKIAERYIARLEKVDEDDMKRQIDALAPAERDRVGKGILAGALAIGLGMEALSESACDAAQQAKFTELGTRMRNRRGN